MGKIRPKKCEGRELTTDQLADNGAFYTCRNCREPMHQTLSKLKDYHRSLGLNVSLYHQDRTLSPLHSASLL